jgi:hypothetical protein
MAGYDFLDASSWRIEKSCCAFEFGPWRACLLMGEVQAWVRQVRANARGGIDYLLPHQFELTHHECLALESLAAAGQGDRSRGAQAIERLIETPRQSAIDEV